MFGVAKGPGGGMEQNEVNLLEQKQRCGNGFEQRQQALGGIYALKDVTFGLKKEIHSIVGHNGAGKSTLMKVIMGVHRPDEGEVILNGKKVSFSSPREAQNAGIAMVWQELSNFPNLTVTENILMHRYKRNRAGR
jgi:rhamnose transport system ATP-binding protein